MALRARQKGESQPGIKDKPKDGPKPTDRGSIFATPSAELQEQLDELASDTPALTEGDEEPSWGPLPEDGLEVDEEPEILGEGGEDFGYDPDGDFSEPQADAEDDTFPGPYMAPPGVPPPAGKPDLVILEATRDGQQVFEVEVPEDVPTRLVQKGLRSSWRAQRIASAIEERRWRLFQIGEIIVDRQRGYFESANADEAYLKLQPLSQDEVARKLGLDKGSVARLVARTRVQTPRFGVVALNVFFGPAGSTLGMRTDVLAAHIRELLKQEDPQHPYSSREIRVLLQHQGFLPQTPTDTEETLMERRLRGVLQDYNIQSRPQRRRERK